MEALITKRPFLVFPGADILYHIDLTGAFGPYGGLPVSGALDIVPTCVRVTYIFEEENTWWSIDQHPEGHISDVASYKKGLIFPNITPLTPENLIVWGPGCLSPKACFTFNEAQVYAAAVIKRLGPDHPQIIWNTHGRPNSGQDQLLPSFEEAYGIVPESHKIYKGTDVKCDSHSGALDALGRPTRFVTEVLAQRPKVKRIFLTCLALNICVAYTALDLVKLGYEVIIILDATRGIDFGGIGYPLMILELVNAGVKFIFSDQLVRAD